MRQINIGLIESSIVGYVKREVSRLQKLHLQQAERINPLIRFWEKAFMPLTSAHDSLKDIISEELPFEENQIITHEYEQEGSMTEDTQSLAEDKVPSQSQPAEKPGKANRSFQRIGKFLEKVLPGPGLPADLSTLLCAAEGEREAWRMELRDKVEKVYLASRPISVESLQRQKVGDKNRLDWTIYHWLQTAGEYSEFVRRDQRNTYTGKVAEPDKLAERYIPHQFFLWILITLQDIGKAFEQKLQDGSRITATEWKEALTRLQDSIQRLIESESDQRNRTLPLSFESGAEDSESEINDINNNEHWKEQPGDNILADDIFSTYMYNYAFEKNSLKAKLEIIKDLCTSDRETSVEMLWSIFCDSLIPEDEIAYLKSPSDTEYSVRISSKKNEIRIMSARIADGDLSVIPARLNELGKKCSIHFGTAIDYGTINEIQKRIIIIPVGMP